MSALYLAGSDQPLGGGGGGIRLGVRRLPELMSPFWVKPEVPLAAASKADLQSSPPVFGVDVFGLLSA